MGDLDTVSVVLFIAGGMLIFGAIKNRNPISIIKNVLAGKGADAVQSADWLAAQNIQTIPGTASPMDIHHSDGTIRVWPDGTPRYVDDPNPDSLPPSDSRLHMPGAPHPEFMAPKDGKRAAGGKIPVPTGPTTMT